MGEVKKVIVQPRRALPVSSSGTAGAFPASESTPGQAESRKAFELLRRNERVLDAPWWDDYHRLRAEGWDWRKAVFIAWSSSPVLGRWPATQEELATECLGLTSDRVIRKWKRNEPGIEERIVLMQAEPLMAHRRDVIQALIDVARVPDPRAHSDRRLFLELTGDYTPRARMDANVDGDYRVEFVWSDANDADSTQEAA